MFIYQLNVSFDEKEIQVMCKLYNYFFKPLKNFTPENYKNINVESIKIALEGSKVLDNIFSFIPQKPVISEFVDKLIKKLK